MIFGKSHSVEIILSLYVAHKSSGLWWLMLVRHIFMVNRNENFFAKTFLFHPTSAGILEKFEMALNEASCTPQNAALLDMTQNACFVYV